MHTKEKVCKSLELGRGRSLVRNGGIRETGRRNIRGCLIEENGLYAQLHYFLNLSQLLVSCLSLLAKLINSVVLDLSSHDNNN